MLIVMSVICDPWNSTTTGVCKCRDKAIVVRRMWSEDSRLTNPLVKDRMRVCERAACVCVDVPIILYRCRDCGEQHPTTITTLLYTQ